MLKSIKESQLSQLFFHSSGAHHFNPQHPLRMALDGWIQSQITCQQLSLSQGACFWVLAPSGPTSRKTWIFSVETWRKAMESWICANFLSLSSRFLMFFWGWTHGISHRVSLPGAILPPSRGTLPPLSRRGSYTLKPRPGWRELLLRQLDAADFDFPDSTNSTRTDLTWFDTFKICPVTSSWFFLPFSHMWDMFFIVFPSGKLGISNWSWDQLLDILGSTPNPHPKLHLWHVRHRDAWLQEPGRWWNWRRVFVFDFGVSP